MSYDVWFEADLGGPEPVTVDLLEGRTNYTCNCAPMLDKAAGIGLRDLSGLTGEEVAAKLIPAVQAMVADPAAYRALNPANGWGGYDSFLTFLTGIVRAARAAPRATFRVA